MPDPIFLCELALEFRMPIGELGSRMSLHEMSVVWPAYFASRKRIADWQARQA